MANYLTLPGSSGHNASTADAAWQDITDDFDIRVDVALDDWATGGLQTLVSKMNSTPFQWAFSVTATGGLRFTLGGIDDYNSTATTGFTAGTQHQVRVTRDRSTGSIDFYTRDPGTALSVDTGWSQLGSTVSGSTGAANTGNTNPLLVGELLAGTAVCAGDFFDAWIASTIDGSAVAWFDADDFTVGDSNGDTAVDLEGNTWTINGANSEIFGSGLEIAGSTFQKAPTFPQGVVAASYGLSGTTFTKAPTFNTGTVNAGAVNLAGSTFQKAPTFPQGTVAAGAVNLAGSTYQLAPTFPTGTVSAGDLALTGTVFQKAPTFPQGTVAASYALTGTTFTKAPTFPTGTIVGDQALVGSAFQVVPTFPTGTISGGERRRFREASVAASVKSVGITAGVKEVDWT